MNQNRSQGVFATVSCAALGILLVGALPIAVMGCATEDGSEHPEPSTRSDLQSSGDPLQREGVHFISATGTNEDATIALFDRDQKAIGGVRTTNGGKSAEIDWKDAHWVIDYAVDDEAPATVHRDGVLVSGGTPDQSSTDAYSQAEQIMFNSLNDAKLPSQIAKAQYCGRSGAICSVYRWCCPGYRCRGGLWSFSIPKCSPN